MDVMNPVIFAGKVMKFTANEGTGARHILVSRTDAIGDVTLTLPLCGLIKELFPGTRITFIGRTYTEPVMACCSAVDTFINSDHFDGLSEEARAEVLRQTGADTILHVFPHPEIASLARKAGIPARVGTRNRLYHWWTCNRLIKLSRKNSELHEAELNLRLLTGLGVSDFPPLSKLYSYYHFQPTVSLPPETAALLAPDRFNLIIHPKSHGSGAEWSLEKYGELIGLLDPGKFRVFISGSKKEETLLAGWIGTLPQDRVTDLTGKLTLPVFIAFIRAADGLVAAGTGPLHISGAAGTHTLGLFPATSPINARRWAPLGEKAAALSSASDRVNDLSANDVLQHILSWTK
jgi:ADP-heptose:LPS heptosyltransferase